MEPIKLTQTVQKGGCAAKVAASELRKVLAQVQFPPTHKELLVDGKHFDDAAIYQISPTQAMVQTIDFFTPILDDPYNFGKVAACNAVSDVYAMGGKPVTAMAVLAFPLATLDTTIIARVLQGASDLLKEAKCTFVGGHSIDDDTLKFGLSVTGLVSTNRIWSNTHARKGDVLILTKPLGTGTVTAALKRELITENDMTDVVESMTRLNNIVDYLDEKQLLAIHSATDITGFGLSGHSYQMATASQVSFHFDFKKIPYFEQAREFLKKEILTKAHRTNLQYTEAYIQARPLSGWEQYLIHDPQTSGGLLLSVDLKSANSIVETLTPHFPGCHRIGTVADAGPNVLVFE